MSDRVREGGHPSHESLDSSQSQLSLLSTAILLSLHPRPSSSFLHYYTTFILTPVMFRSTPLASLSLASVVFAQTYSQTFTPASAPKTSRPTQAGTNQCGSLSSQDSMCQNVYGAFTLSQPNAHNAHDTYL